MAATERRRQNPGADMGTDTGTGAVTARRAASAPDSAPEPSTAAAPAPGLYDQAGRQISCLRLSVTERCGFGCIYCTGGRSHGCRRDDLPLEEILTLARGAALAGCTRIRLTGGEPLERVDLPEIIRGLAEIPGITSLGLTTNGCRLAAAARELADAGIRDVNVSLDSADPGVLRQITGRSCLDQILAGIEAALEAGCRVKINTVLLKGLNDDPGSIHDLADLIFRHPLDLRFIELMPADREDFSHERYFAPAEAVFRALPGLVPAEDESQNAPARNYVLKGARGRIGIISPVTRKFCRTCNRIRITADGMLRPCLLSRREFPLRGLTSEEVAKIIRDAVSCKPREHRLTAGCGGSSGQSMPGGRRPDRIRDNNDRHLSRGSAGSGGCNVTARQSVNRNGCGNGNESGNRIRNGTDNEPAGSPDDSSVRLAMGRIGG